MLTQLERRGISGIRFITFDDNRWLQFCTLSAIRQKLSAIRQNTAILTDSIREIVCTKSSEPRKVLIPQDLLLRREGLIG